MLIMSTIKVTFFHCFYKRSVPLRQDTDFWKMLLGVWFNFCPKNKKYCNVYTVGTVNDAVFSYTIRAPL